MRFHSFFLVSVTLILVIAFALSSPSLVFAADTNLVRIVTKPKVYVGQLVSETSEVIQFVDLATFTEKTLMKEDVTKIEKSLSLDDAGKSVGLARMTAWGINLLAKRMQEVGKVAKITPQLVYVTIGSNTGIRTGAALTVYRDKGEITNPDTDEVIGKERAKIAQLEVVEVEEAYSKAKVVGNLEVELRIGDEVQISSGMRVAVCPIQNEDGTLTDAGARITEDITTHLVEVGVAVVERSSLGAALGELLIQSNLLLDQTTTVQLGELTGANAVVIGRMVRTGNSGQAYLRLINVATGKVMFAVSGFVSLRNVKAIPLDSVYFDGIDLKNDDSDSEKSADTESKKSLESDTTVFRGSYSDGILSKSSSVQLNKTPNDNYRLTVEFEKTGSDTLVFMLPIGSSNVNLVLDHEHGRFTGLANLDGKDASKNETTRTDVKTIEGRNNLVIQVRKSGARAAITVILNGTEIIDWQGATQRLGSNIPWFTPDLRKIGVGTADCTLKLNSWSVSP